MTTVCCVCLQLGRYRGSRGYREATETVTHDGRDYQACGEHAPLLEHGLAHAVAAVKRSNPTKNAT